MVERRQSTRSEEIVSRLVIGVGLSTVEVLFNKDFEPPTSYHKNALSRVQVCITEMLPPSISVEGRDFKIGDYVCQKSNSVRSKLAHLQAGWVTDIKGQVLHIQSEPFNETKDGIIRVMTTILLVCMCSQLNFTHISPQFVHLGPWSCLSTCAPKHTLLCCPGEMHGLLGLTAISKGKRQRWRALTWLSS